MNLFLWLSLPSPLVLNSGDQKEKWQRKADFVRALLTCRCPLDLMLLVLGASAKQKKMKNEEISGFRLEK